MTHNDFISNPLEFWMSLFPSATREKPRFSALAEAILQATGSQLEAWETLTDTGGNNVTVQTTGTLPLPVQELLPVPVGVAVVRY